jgi:hypothetical protein
MKPARFTEDSLRLNLADLLQAYRDMTQCRRLAGQPRRALPSFAVSVPVTRRDFRDGMVTDCRCRSNPGGRFELGQAAFS